MRTPTPIITFAAAFGLLAGGCTSSDGVNSTSDKGSVKAPVLEPYECGEMTRLHVFGDIFLGSMPSASDLQQAKDGGIRTIVNLRTPEEHPDFDEQGIADSLGIAYENPGFSSPDAMTDAKIDEALSVLREAERPLLMHCKSANRVGAIWTAHRVVNDGIKLEDALKEARVVGLRSPDLEQGVRRYLSTR